MAENLKAILFKKKREIFIPLKSTYELNEIYY